MVSTISAILLVTILILAVPVHLVFALKKTDVWRGRIVVYWLFGLIHMTLRPTRAEKARRLGRELRRGRKVASLSRQVVKRRRYISSLLRSEGAMRRAAYLVRDLLRALRPRRFRFRCVVGLDDPADTGRLMGFLAPLRLFAGRNMAFGKNTNVAFQVSPDFTGRRCTGYWCASVGFVPLKLVGIFLGFLLSPPVLRAARGLMQRSNA